MNYISIDLEMEQPSNEILSVGVAVWCEAYDEFHSKNFYITPSVPVSQFIQNLTGLRDSDFDWNKARSTCYAEMIKWIADLERSIGKIHNQAVVWGGGDIPLLKKDLALHGLDQGRDFHFRTTFLNVATLITMDRIYRGQNPSARTSLTTAMNKLGVSSSGAKHNSEHDAINTLRCFKSIVDTERDKLEAIQSLTRFK